ncbi:MAG: redoxin domain-containing protein [Gemmataceae bacterium]|nr:redoxin domain-containing protein [Gemmataceae bacterium]
MIPSLLSLSALLSLAAAPPAGVRVSLTGIDGRPRAFPDPSRRLTVAVFLSVECPMSNGYLPALNDLAGRYKEVAFVGVAGRDDSAEALRAHAREYRIAIPLVRDEAGVLSRATGARIYPEAVVLDRSGRVRYRGRIDDAYTARMKAKAKTTRRDLEAALDELLAGKPASVPRTVAFGCPIPGSERRAVAARPTTSYHRDIAPILQSACQECHRPGQAGPFPLMEYRHAKRWADDIVGETKARRMPPWKAAQRGHFANERSLTGKQAATLARWVEEGMPEGDRKDAPKPVAFSDDWKLGKPDLVLEAKEDVVIGPTGRDAFHCLVFPTKFEEDRFIAAVEVRPGNPRVVHHTVQVIDTRKRTPALIKRRGGKTALGDDGPGYWSRMGFGFIPDPSKGLGGWAPGLVPQKLPVGVGQLLPRGSDIVMQVHYHRTGKVERDRTRIGLYFQKGEVKGHFQAMPVPGLFMMIPAGSKETKVASSWRLTEDMTLHYVIPHMHLLGKSIEMTAKLPGKKEETVISIPEWDYDWQEMYQLRKPRKLPKGTVLTVRATFDNSAGNPRNPSDPPVRVRFGEQTTHEMCFVFCGIHTDRPGFPKFTVSLFGG